MRSAIALSIVASAAAVSAATNCNPSYNVATSGECFTGCNVKAGQTYLSGWTMDSTSDKFIASLKIMCTKGTSQYIAFMTTAGMCMASCTDNQDLFNNEFAGACTWYAEHKDDTCAADAATTTVPATTTTAAADASATTANASATTAAASSVFSSVSSVASAASSGAAVVSSAASAAASSVATSAASPATSPATAESSSSKMQIGGYAMALVACASYFAL